MPRAKKKYTRPFYWMGPIAFSLISLSSAAYAEEEPELVLGFGHRLLAAGADHSAVRCANSMVFAWGNNELGQLGDGAGIDAYNPVVVRDDHLELLLGVLSIASGANHLLALRDDGTVVGWGDNASNQVTDTVWDSPYSSLFKSVPGAYQGPYEEEPGAYQGPYLRGADTNDSSIFEHPVQVMETGGPMTEARVINASGNLSVALRVDGSAVAWGNTDFLQVEAQDDEPVVNDSGNSGTTATTTDSNTDGTTAESSTTTAGPTMMVLLGVDGAPVKGLVKIAAGDSHIVGLHRSGRVLYWSDYEILTRRLQIEEGLKARYVKDPNGNIIESATDVAAAGDYSLALLSNTRVLAWGDTTINLFGEVAVTDTGNGDGDQDTGAGGDGNEGDTGSGGADLLKPTADSQTTTSNNSGTDANLDYEDRLALINHNEIKAEYIRHVNGDRLSNVKALAASESHILALLHNGHVVAVGDNTSGELGDGTNTTSDDNVVIVTNYLGNSLGDIEAIASGESHNLALSEDGFVYAWGAGDSGQLGDGTNVASYYAVPVRDIFNEPFNINFSCIPVY